MGAPRRWLLRAVRRPLPPRRRCLGPLHTDGRPRYIQPKYSGEFLCQPCRQAINRWDEPRGGLIDDDAVAW